MLEYRSSLLPLEASERSLHLLMVEDSPLDVELMAGTLERSQILFDAVLTDYSLPGFTPTTLCNCCGRQTMKFR